MAGSNQGSSLGVPRAILIVDDDPGTCETFRRVPRDDGYAVETASSGHEALERVGRQAFDLVLLDFRLPDMRGTDLARAMSRNGLVPFVLMSGYLTTEVTVEAMRLGAAHVLDKLWIEVLLETVSASFQQRMTTPPVSSALSLATLEELARRQPSSTPERWALCVIKGCLAKADLTSLERWAAAAGASQTSLAETCRLLDIPARDARDLTRVLRAIARSREERVQPDAFLLVSDSRTLYALMERAGLTDVDWATLSVDAFLANQRFVSLLNDGVKALKTMLTLG